LTKNISKNPFEDKKKKYGNRNKPLTQEQVEVFKQAFEIFDSNKSGVRNIDYVDYRLRRVKGIIGSLRLLMYI
jgi:Ca2+-binding EF-hand superfamily protein